eukprot:scaffold9354_cov88-Skeletonema_dohrnii-CCMP3373.AAC.1
MGNVNHSTYLQPPSSQTLCLCLWTCKYEGNQDHLNYLLPYYKMLLVLAAVVAPWSAAVSAYASAFITPFQATTGRYVYDVVTLPLPPSLSNHKFFEWPHHTTSSLRVRVTTEPAKSNHNQLFDDFLQAKERRDALLSTAMFQKADGVIIEAIVQTMEKIPVEKNQNLFLQGEASDGSMYVVASGTFECVVEETGEVKKECRMSDVFGEISPKFGTTRALTVKASSDDATVWKIPYQDFIEGIKSKTDTFDNSIVSAIEQNPEYAAYFAMKKRSDVFQKSAFFKSLQPRDFDEVVKSAHLRHLAEGEVLFNEGDQGDTMYVVKEGSIDIISEKSKKVLKTYKQGGAFGELAIFFSESNQRKASARAAEDTQVWEIKKDVLFEVVQESDLATQALNAYRAAYKDKQFNVAELKDYLAVKSRPKKKPVSFHSTFTIFSAGFAVAAESMQVSPGLGSNGYFQIFDIYQNLSSSSLMQFQIAAWLMAASGVMGIFRLPPNSPNNRRLLFQFWTWTNLSNAAILSSNLCGYPAMGWYDGLKFPGDILILSTVLMTYISSLRLLDDAIVGSNRGREANPLATTRVQAFTISLVAIVLSFVTQTSVLIGILSEAGVSTFSMMSLEEGSEFATVLRMLGVFYWPAILQSSVGALLATLQFEKKISPKTGAFIAIVFLSILNYDGFYTLFKHPSQMPDMSELYYFACPPYFYVYWGAVFVTIAQAFWKRAQFDEAEKLKID